MKKNYVINSTLGTDKIAKSIEKELVNFAYQKIVVEKEKNVNITLNLEVGEKTTSLEEVIEKLVDKKISEKSCCCGKNDNN